MSKYERTLRRVERELRKRNNEVPCTEKGYSIDRFGNIVVEQVGDRWGIRHTDEQLKKMSSTTYTHNHPDGGPFSIGDIRFALLRKVKEVRAITKEGTYIITFDYKKMNQEIFYSFSMYLRSVYSPIEQSVYYRQCSREIGYKRLHQIWREVFESVDWATYELRRWEYEIS